MARRKEFDPDQALAKAMAVFWRLGYENTSLELLLREMGIAKQSLYDTYGDKRGLYMKALAYYRRQTNDGLRGLFGAGRPVKEVFAKLLFGLSAESRATTRTRLSFVERQSGARHVRCYTRGVSARQPSRSRRDF